MTQHALDIAAEYFDYREAKSMWDLLGAARSFLVPKLVRQQRRRFLRALDRFSSKMEAFNEAVEAARAIMDTGFEHSFAVVQPEARSLHTAVASFFGVIAELEGHPDLRRRARSVSLNQDKFCSAVIAALDASYKVERSAAGTLLNVDKLFRGES